MCTRFVLDQDQTQLFKAFAKGSANLTRLKKAQGAMGVQGQIVGRVGFVVRGNFAARKDVGAWCEAGLFRPLGEQDFKAGGLIGVVVGACPDQGRGLGGLSVERRGIKVVDGSAHALLC